MRPIDQAWVMAFRNGLRPDGDWHAWEGTASRTRRGCIDAFVEGHYAGVKSENEYRNLRRRGLVRCVRATLWADVPETDDE